MGQRLRQRKGSRKHYLFSGVIFYIERKERRLGRSRRGNFVILINIRPQRASGKEQKETIHLMKFQMWSVVKETAGNI